MGQPKVEVKHAHGDGKVPPCTFSTNSLKQNKHVESAKEDGGDSMTKKNKQWVFPEAGREESKCYKATPNLVP